MEMLGFFIILGVLVVVVLRHQIWPTTEGGRGKAEEVEEASRRMKREMEQSADEIIARMGAHIDRLEHLVEEADARAKALEEQLKALKNPALSKSGEEHGDDFDDLLAASLAVENEVGQMSPPLRTPPSSRSDVYGVHDGARYHVPEVRGVVDTAELEEDSLFDAQQQESELLTVEAWEKGAPFVEEPEIVVSASVADVADLPMTPEEEAWAAAEEGLPDGSKEGDSVPPVFQETALGEGVAAPSLPLEDMYEAGDEAPVEHVDMQVYVSSDGYAPFETAPVATGIYESDEGRETSEVSMPGEGVSAFPDEIADFSDDMDDRGLSHHAAQAEAFFAMTTGAEAPAEVSASAEEAMQEGEGTGEEAVHPHEAAGDDDMSAPFPQERIEAPSSPALTFPSSPSSEGDSMAQKIRERLSEGRATADIARELHIGRGAVELISQMDKNKIEG